MILQQEIEKLAREAGKMILDADLGSGGHVKAVTKTGRKSKGIKVDGIYYAKGGTVTANVDAAATRK